jgi:hypothetical protein
MALITAHLVEFTKKLMTIERKRGKKTKKREKRNKGITYHLGKAYTNSQTTGNLQDHRCFCVSMEYGEAQ